ncbi:MAG TPA: MFS transporter [Acidimicrobiia bacterium]|nr:MFS transporter [Acidimicrobiia bacterium]
MAPGPGTVSRRRAIVAIAIGAVMIDATLLGLIAPLLPTIEERTGAGPDALGVTLAAYAVPIAALSLPLGRIADRLGRRLLLAVGLMVVGAGSGLIAASDSLALLVAARAVQGVGSAASWIAALALVSDTAPPGKRGEALGVAIGATGVGSIAGPALGGVAADVVSFEAPFLICCGAAVGLSVAALVLLPRDPKRSSIALPALATIRHVLRASIGRWASAIILVSALVLGVVEVVAPLDLDDRLGLSSAAIGLLFAGSIAVDAGIAPLGGRWGDRRGRLVPARAGLAITALSALLLAALPGVAGTAIALGIYGAGFSLCFAAAVPMLDESFDEAERGLAYGFQNVLYAGGYALGPIAGGLLLDVASAKVVYVGTAAAVVGATIALLVGDRSKTPTERM